MNKIYHRFFLHFVFLSLFFSCASKPKLYPNQTLKSKGKAAGEADIDKCIKEANEYLESSSGKKIAKGAGAGAALGGAIGAVSGLFYGDFGGGLARGAAIGGTAGAASGALSPDEIKHRYVNQCLTDKGYQVIGWD